MKRLISLVIAAAVSVSIFGCAEKKASPPVTPPANNDAKPASDAPAATPAPEGGATPAPEGKAP